MANRRTITESGTSTRIRNQESGTDPENQELPSARESGTVNRRIRNCDTGREPENQEIRDGHGPRIRNYLPGLGCRTTHLVLHADAIVRCPRPSIYELFSSFRASPEASASARRLRLAGVINNFPVSVAPFPLLLPKRQSLTKLSGVTASLEWGRLAQLVLQP